MSTEGAACGLSFPWIGGDVIVAINGQPVETFDDLVTYLVRSTEVGEKVTLTVLRGGREQQIEVTLSERPSTSVSPASKTAP